MKFTLVSAVNQKNIVLTVVGAFGAVIAKLLGGWDMASEALLIFMIFDYLSGYAVAAIFKKSNKTKSGGLSSSVGWKGLCKKGMTWGVIIVFAEVDKLFNISFARDVAIYGFLSNEFLSIMENAALMGLKIPKELKARIDVLFKKGGIIK